MLTLYNVKDTALRFEADTEAVFYFTFSHLADAFIQNDLQIRKITSSNYKYYTYTFKKIEKCNKNDKCIQQHFKTKHLNENKKHNK